MMANSSDWIGALAEAEPDQASGRGVSDWIRALPRSAEFREGYVFADTAQLAGQVGDCGSDVPGGTEREPAADATARAFADGEAAGRAAMQSELDQVIAHQRDIRLAFRTLDQSAMDALAQELSATVLSLCTQVLSESAIDADALLQRARDAARTLGTAADQCVLHLHPADIDTLGQHAPQTWTIHPDTALERGSLRLEGGDGEVLDGPDQWRRAIAEALRG
ncbi:hypothetical protein FGU71_03815 [Erythrobacter insulae]|uniref:Flagellar assembly protein FliH n=1 Tax=Erythrobacter insulae TaxID=2584124 RepID=A0A547PA97_9SPHN|nr:FliH/SctL family protein [Erythrobacter insulae]TRD11063.1 hypothetical protein FGU71_03815 [Erythrobacter insulae]